MALACTGMHLTKKWKGRGFRDVLLVLEAHPLHGKLCVTLAYQSRKVQSRRIDWWTCSFEKASTLQLSNTEEWFWFCFGCGSGNPCGIHAGLSLECLFWDPLAAVKGISCCFVSLGFAV